MYDAIVIPINGYPLLPLTQYRAFSWRDLLRRVYIPAFHPIGILGHSVAQFLEKPGHAVYGFPGRVVEIQPGIVPAHDQISYEYCSRGTVRHAVA